MNNRDQTQVYDEAGNVIQTDLRNFVYDAAGSKVTGYKDEVTYGYDGDGHRVRADETVELAEGGTGTYRFYYVRSSVLGGQTIAEVDATGEVNTAAAQNLRRYIYLDGELLASHNSFWKQVQWHVTDPRRTTDIETS